MIQSWLVRKLYFSNVHGGHLGFMLIRGSPQSCRSGNHLNIFYISMRAWNHKKQFTSHGNRAIHRSMSQKTQSQHKCIFLQSKHFTKFVICCDLYVLLKGGKCKIQIYTCIRFFIFVPMDLLLPEPFTSVGLQKEKRKSRDLMLCLQD